MPLRIDKSALPLSRSCTGSLTTLLLLLRLDYPLVCCSDARLQSRVSGFIVPPNPVLSCSLAQRDSLRKTIWLVKNSSGWTVRTASNRKNSMFRPAKAGRSTFDGCGLPLVLPPEPRTSARNGSSLAGSMPRSRPAIEAQLVPGKTTVPRPLPADSAVAPHRETRPCDQSRP